MSTEANMVKTDEPKITEFELRKRDRKKWLGIWKNTTKAQRDAVNKTVTMDREDVGEGVGGSNRETWAD